MAFPKFSIVIPTVDRHELLEKTIAICLLSPYPNLEVLVSDNFSGPDTARVVEGFRADPRVRYVRTAQRLSMPDHWEFAWQQSTGDYIIINGDDDGLAPDLVGQLSCIALTLNAALMSWDAGLYYHPDWNLSGANTFVFMSSHSRLLFDINPQAIFASYARLEVPPCFPQGTRICFSRKLAIRAQARTERIFWSPYPDFSAPLLLLGLLQGERYIYWDALKGYGGRSRNSNAAAWDKEQGKTGNRQRASEYFKELDKEDIYPHSELKLRAYCNGHAETLNLLRLLLPEVFERHQVDPVALIAGIESEFQGIGIHNPFLGPRERIEFDAFVAEQDSVRVLKAMQIVKARKRDNSIEVFRVKRFRASWAELIPLIHPKILLWAMTLAARGLARTLTASADRPKTQSARPKMAVRRISQKVWLDCAGFGGKDALDLVRRFDEIVAECDHRESLNLAALFNGAYFSAAHEVSVLSGPDGP